MADIGDLMNIFISIFGYRLMRGLWGGGGGWGF